MKKLLTYLMLIACFESFISAGLSVYYNQKKASITEINISANNKVLQQDDINTEIHPLDIFSFHVY